MKISITEADIPGPSLTIAQLFANGWRYIDITSWVSEEIWKEFETMWGAGNYRVIAMSITQSRGVHAQVMLAPAAFERMKAWTAARKN